MRLRPAWILAQNIAASGAFCTMYRNACGLWGFVAVFLMSISSGTPAAAQQQHSGSAIPIPALSPGRKPNFIMILTDDVGYDDLGFHNVRVSTPNIDKLRQRSTAFENFYTSPQCAQSRAQFLTGRSFARTGTMCVAGGWDFINRDEVTIAEAMAAGGYRTAHLGKWHELQVLGYEPWLNGFQYSYIPPTTGADGEGLARVNGRYVTAQEAGNVFDKDLRNQTIKYLQERVQDGQPFFVFLAARSIHTNAFVPDPVTGKPMMKRLVPAEYRDKFNSPEYNGVADSTKDAWAFMAYLDDAMGPLFDFITSSGLDQSTYILFTGDNGPAVYRDEASPPKKKIRMPSGMAGAKQYLTEGGIRNSLVVQGPGVKPGATDNTMIGISDIFPTMLDIAGVPLDPQPALDGVSFRSVLLPDSNSNQIDGSRDAGAADAEAAGAVELQQQSSLTNRYFFMLGPACWGANTVPELAPDRTVVKPQKLLDFHEGGSTDWTGKDVVTQGPGMKACIVVRFRNYKWHGSSGKVYQFGDETQHLEGEQTEVTGTEGAYLARRMATAAESWWQSIIKEPSSFQKPTFYLGMGEWNVTNMVAAGAHERSPASILLLVNGATGFYSAGESMCFKLKVLTAGTYTATATYTSNIRATFRLSVGSYASIKAGNARNLTMQWPAQTRMRGMLLGQLLLPASKEERTEACLELLSSPALDGKTAVFSNFANIQWTRINQKRPRAPQLPDGVNPMDIVHKDDTGAADTFPVAVPAAGLNLSGRYGWLRNLALHTDRRTSQDVWTSVRLKNGWTDGQSVLESMFSPYDAEGIEQCPPENREACRPPV